MEPVLDFGDAVLGAGLPASVRRTLEEAGQCRGTDPARAKDLLMRAQGQASDHPAVLIALYRHHFYGHRMDAAREIAQRALVAGAGALGLPPAWRAVPAVPLAGTRSDPRTRFYLFVLKGYAYLSLRLGESGEARDALAKLRELDPDDHVGGALIEAVRVRALAGDAAGLDEEAMPAVFGAAAWARAGALAAAA